MTEWTEPIISNAEDAARLKGEMKTQEAKQWWHLPAAGVDHAVLVANAPPAQQAGEVIFSVRDDGNVDLFLFF